MSTIATAVAALVTTLTNANPGVLVIDGPPTTELPNDYVAVDISDSGPATQGTQDWAALGNRRKQEDYTIRCEASSWSGNTGAGSGDYGMSGPRARAWQLFDACEAAIRADPTLGGVTGLRQAQVTEFDGTATQTPKGPVYTVGFHVHVSITRI